MSRLRNQFHQDKPAGNFPHVSRWLLWAAIGAVALIGLFVVALFILVIKLIDVPSLNFQQILPEALRQLLAAGQSFVDTINQITAPFTKLIHSVTQLFQGGQGG